MEVVFDQLLGLLFALWWPFCRSLALLAAAPAIGEATVPMPLRALLALVLAVVMLPLVPAHGRIDPFSLEGVAATFAEVLIGAVIGLSFQLAVSVILVLGYIVSSQMGLAMAVMNDPVNGTSSDVASAMLSLLCTLVFFAVDGHLVVVGVLGASFRAWPIGTALNALVLQTLVFNVAWVFSAALLLAVPIVFSTMVVQIGFGLLNRVAPSLNLFSLGFSVVTLFGVLLLAALVRFVPDHYVRMTGQVLEMLQQQMRMVPHG